MKVRFLGGGTKPDSITERIDKALRFTAIGGLLVVIGVAFPESPLGLGMLVGALLGLLALYNAAVAAVAQGVKLGFAESRSADDA